MMQCQSLYVNPWMNPPRANPNNSENELEVRQRRWDVGVGVASGQLVNIKNTNTKPMIQWCTWHDLDSDTGTMMLFPMRGDSPSFCPATMLKNKNDNRNPNIAQFNSSLGRIFLSSSFFFFDYLIVCLFFLSFFFFFFVTDMYECVCFFLCVLTLFQTSN